MGRFCVVGSLYAANGDRKYLNAEERGCFIEAAQAAGPEERTFCLTLAYTGCRISEALNLMPRHLQRTGIVSIRCLKKRGKLMVRDLAVLAPRGTALQKKPVRP